MSLAGIELPPRPAKAAVMQLRLRRDRVGNTCRLRTPTFKERVLAGVDAMSAYFTAGTAHRVTSNTGIKPTREAGSA